METVLNPALFFALKNRFGKVRIANQGLHFQSMQVKDADGQPTVKVLEAGEQYKVCCPYCGDTRFRLYISHVWNTVDPTTRRKQNKHLIHCFNEKCDLSNIENELKMYVNYNTVLPKKPLELRPVTELFPEVKLPGRCVDLDKLQSDHEAIKYITSRNFDPAELQRDWGVCYCEDAESDKDGFIPGTRVYARLVKNRIIIPVMWQNKLVGWQARALEPHKVKYYTMPGLNKSYMLFNGDRARLHRFGVVVEGAFDAFRVGPRAVALLGSSMSFHQRALVSAFWSTGAMCILLDPDAVEDMDNMQSLFAPGTFRWGSFSVLLPENNDPADMDRTSLWRIISGCALNRGIQLTSV